MHNQSIAGQAQFSEEIMVSAHWLHAVEDRHEQDAPVRVHRVAHNREFMMKAILFGLFMAAVAADAAVPASDEEVLRVFRICSYGALAGALAGLCVKSGKPKDITGLAQELLGNLLLSVALGPSATFWLAARMSVVPDPYWFISVSTILGIVGLAVVRAAKSDLVSLIVAQMGFKKTADGSQ